MIKKRKGQGLSLNVMILAILALVVLIVLIAIFSKQSGTSIRSIESCEGKGGKCAYDLPAAKCGKDFDGKNYPVPIILSGDCEKSTNKEIKGLCCISITNE